MSEDYLKMRNKIRFNVVVASLFCFVAVFLAVIYGTSFLALYWVTGSYAVAVASLIGAMVISILILGFWLKIVIKMRAKLASMNKAVPSRAVSA